MKNFFFFLLFIFLSIFYLFFLVKHFLKHKCSIAFLFLSQLVNHSVDNEIILKFMPGSRSPLIFPLGTDNGHFSFTVLVSFGWLQVRTLQNRQQTTLGFLSPVYTDQSPQCIILFSFCLYSRQLGRVSHIYKYAFYLKGSIGLTLVHNFVRSWFDVVFCTSLAEVNCRRLQPALSVADFSGPELASLCTGSWEFHLKQLVPGVVGTQPP